MATLSSLSSSHLPTSRASDASSDAHLLSLLSTPASVQRIRHAANAFAQLTGLLTHAAADHTTSNNGSTHHSASNPLRRPTTTTTSTGAAPATPNPLLAELDDVIRHHYAHDDATAQRLYAAKAAALMRDLDEGVKAIAWAAERVWRVRDAAKDARMRRLMAEMDAEAAGGVNGEHLVEEEGNMAAADAQQERNGVNGNGAKPTETAIVVENEDSHPLLDIHVKLVPSSSPLADGDASNGTVVAYVIVRDAALLHACTSGLYIDAFLNEGRLGGGLEDYATLSPSSSSTTQEASSVRTTATTTTSSSSASSSLVLGALSHLRRASLNASKEAEAIKLARLQDAKLAAEVVGKQQQHQKGVAGTAMAVMMRRKKAVGLGFLGAAEDEGGVETEQQASGVAAADTASLSLPPLLLRSNATITATFISKCVFRCSLEALPLWADVRRAVEMSLMGEDQSLWWPSSSSSPATVRQGAIAALAYLTQKRRRDETDREGKESAVVQKGQRCRISCSLDLTSEGAAAITTSSEVASVVGSKRPRGGPSSSASAAAAAATNIPLPDFPSPHLDAVNVLAVYRVEAGRSNGATTDVLFSAVHHDMMPSSNCAPLHQIAASFTRVDAKAMAMEKAFLAKRRAAMLRREQEEKDRQRQREHMEETAAAKRQTAEDGEGDASGKKSVVIVPFIVQDDGLRKVDFMNAML